MTPAADPTAHFVEKWHRREPEMALAEVFCPPGQRPVFRAWGALLHELREATFELSDARVTAAKSQWWAEELLLVARGAGRHPLCADLPPALPWAALARAVLEQANFDGRPADAAHALQQVAPLAEAIAAIETGLHGAPPPVRAVAVNLLLHRLPHGLVAEDQARLPLALLARHGLTVAQVAEGQGEALLRDWARELLAALPAPMPASSLYRRLRTGFDRARLQRLAAGRGFDPPPAPASLWRAWRLARAG
jgi:phytoene/squalene synthetase